MLKQLFLLLFSTVLLLATPKHCTLDLTLNTAELLCEDETLNFFIEHAKGKLTNIQDSSGSTSFSYNKDGNIIQIEKTINNRTFTQNFSYNQDGKLTSRTLPSGKTLEYSYNQKGELQSISLDSQTIIEDIKSSNLGLLSYTYPNGTTHTRVYDTNGRVTKLIYPNYQETIDYNAVNNITSLTTDSQTKRFDYDNLDRLIGYDLNRSEYQRFTYDANGNRLSLNQEINKTVSYLYKANSNMLQTIKDIKKIDENTTEVENSVTLQYDTIGNLIQDANHTYTYDAKNRLVRVDSNIIYKYDYDNKRVSKSVNGVTTYFIYDGYKLLGEYKEDGEPIKEYIYYNDIPVALIQDDTIYYIYSDHLNTPRRVANQENQIIWSWESKPFGESKPNDDMDEDNNTFTLNLRFPGQYYDEETGTHYNINRDYNPITGRYIQSDPIGLDGGINTYLYVGANPIVRVDLEGKDAVYIEYIGYPAYTGFNWSDGSKIYAPVGHAAVIAIDEKTGYTRYYEYGRYDKENRGIVKKREVPNVIIRDGKPTEESLQQLYKNASKNWGKGYPTFTIYYDSVDYNDVVSYAERVKADPNRSDYMLYFNDCMSFANDAIDAGLPFYYTSWGF